MAYDPTSAFLDTLVHRLAASDDLVRLVAEHVSALLVGRRGLDGAGRGSHVFASQMDGAKKAPGRPRGSKSGSASGASERVLAAIRGGASRRADVMAKAGVSAAGYSYALKVLRQKGLVKVHGQRGGATVTAS